MSLFERRKQFLKEIEQNVLSKILNHIENELVIDGFVELKVENNFIIFNNFYCLKSLLIKTLNNDIYKDVLIEHYNDCITLTFLDLDEPRVHTSKQSYESWRTV